MITGTRTIGVLTQPPSESVDPSQRSGSWLLTGDHGEPSPKSTCACPGSWRNGTNISRSRWRCSCTYALTILIPPPYPYSSRNRSKDPLRGMLLFRRPSLVLLQDPIDDPAECASFGRAVGRLRRYPGGTENASIFATPSSCRSRTAASRRLSPSTYTAQRTCP